MDHTSTGAAPVKTGKADRRADLPFLVITLTLLGVGVVMVLSASFASAATSRAAGASPAAVESLRKEASHSSRIASAVG